MFILSYHKTERCHMRPPHHTSASESWDYWYLIGESCLLGEQVLIQKSAPVGFFIKVGADVRGVIMFGWKVDRESECVWCFLSGRVACYACAKKF